MEDVKEEKRKLKIRNLFKKPAKNVFWAWIAYQTIKGTLTLSFIWIPLFYYLWFSK